MQSTGASRFTPLLTLLLAVAVGVGIGWLVAVFIPPRPDRVIGHGLNLLLCVPFVLLLLLIAIMPVVSGQFWHRWFGEIGLALGAVVATYEVMSPGTEGLHRLLHGGREYISFIALVGGLYVVSGGILIDVRGQGRPWSNTLILLFGAILANVVGTTGASVLLIRPFIRFNRGRLRATHIIFFIFIVSNCGGCLTPVGDPPLYLGFLKGIPFFWTVEQLWKDWLAVVGGLLLMFFVIDSYFERTHSMRGIQHTDPPESELHRLRHGRKVTVRGAVGLVCLALMVLGVFVDPLLKRVVDLGEIPAGAIFQVVVAFAAYFLSKRELYVANEFSFFPVKEVGLLFLGIFATMIPALATLAVRAPEFNVSSPTQFYFLTGSLSAVLDNAPTYLNFLQVAIGDVAMNADVIRERLLTGDGALVLSAISTGAVFFGAMTYIGNGPNFMVRAIAESAGVRMPSFGGYLLRAMIVLLPVLVIHWFILIR